MFEKGGFSGPSFFLFVVIDNRRFSVSFYVS
jgi:hypothetical protein